ncbi:MAG: hypothetical protein H0U92_09560 [Actinobacteria bacterium]|nr:hypothetical protein [Actinomycetota bacterium]
MTAWRCAIPTTRRPTAPAACTSRLPASSLATAKRKVACYISRSTRGRRAVADSLWYPNVNYRGQVIVPTRFSTNVAFAPGDTLATTGAFDNVRAPFKGEIRLHALGG